MPFFLFQSSHLLWGPLTYGTTQKRDREFPILQQAMGNYRLPATLERFWNPILFAQISSIHQNFRRWLAICPNFSYGVSHHLHHLFHVFSNLFLRQFYHSIIIILQISRIFPYPFSSATIIHPLISKVCAKQEMLHPYPNFFQRIYSLDRRQASINQEKSGATQTLVSPFFCGRDAAAPNFATAVMGCPPHNNVFQAETLVGISFQTPAGRCRRGEFPFCFRRGGRRPG